MNTQVQVMKKENGKIQFSKDFLLLQMEIGNSVKTDIVDSSRWSIHYDWIFKFEDKFYQSSYSVGATESQDESPYEYEGEWVDCHEVHQVEKLVKIWEPLLS